MTCCQRGQRGLELGAAHIQNDNGACTEQFDSCRTGMHCNHQHHPSSDHIIACHTCSRCAGAVVYTTTVLLCAALLLLLYQCWHLPHGHQCSRGRLRWVITQQYHVVGASRHGCCGCGARSVDLDMKRHAYNMKSTQ